MAASLTSEDVLWGDLKALFQDFPDSEVTLKYIKELNNKGSASSEEIKQYLTWCRNRQYVKVTESDVPDGILPNNYSGKLIDIKVQPARWGPDDHIYETNSDIREKVARGNCLLELTKGSSVTYHSIVRGLNKFTGGLGDDDDSNCGDEFIWQKFFSKPLTEAEKVVSLSKANGESAHFSAFYLDDVFYYCAGSKNVQMIFKRKDDVDKYTESRYGIAREIAAVIVEEMDRLKPTSRRKLLSFLHYAKCTAAMELLHPEHQHVQSLNHIARPEVHFISWVSNSPSASTAIGFCALPPHIGIQIARTFDLRTVDFKILQPREAENHMTEIRQGHGYEGEVLYFLDKNSQVIGMLKKKTAWYIILRALREKVKNACRQISKDGGSTNCNGKVKSRICEIQRWLQLDDKSTAQWQALALCFFRWCCSEFKDGNISINDVNNLFPNVWNKYLTETNQTDRISIKQNRH